VADERGIGDNGGPPLVDRTFKKRWAFALFARPDKPAGAVAMGFKIYMEMDSAGRGATISDAEFMVACGVSDGSCRVFKRWLLSNGFIQIMKRGYRGHRSEFMATIPGEQIPAALAAIGIEIPAANAGSNGEEYRQPMPAETNNLPATTAAISEVAAPVAGIPPRAPARIEPPSGVNIINKQTTTTTTVESEAARGGGGEDYLDHLNGTAVDLAKFIAKHAGGIIEEPEARRMLSANIKAFGADAMVEAYSMTIAEMAGGVVGNAYRYLLGTAKRIKDGKAAKADRSASATPESKRERRQKALDEAAARIDAENSRRRGL
jgi:hypothetical protein